MKRGYCITRAFGHSLLTRSRRCGATAALRPRRGIAGASRSRSTALRLPTQAVAQRKLPRQGRAINARHELGARAARKPRERLRSSPRDAPCAPCCALPPCAGRARGAAAGRGCGCALGWDRACACTCACACADTLPPDVPPWRALRGSPRALRGAAEAGADGLAPAAARAGASDALAAVVGGARAAAAAGAAGAAGALVAARALSARRPPRCRSRLAARGCCWLPGGGAG